MNAVLSEPLDRLHRLVVQLFQSLGPPNSKPPPPPTTADLLQADLQLASALHTARAHQRRQRRIEELITEITGLDDELRDVFKTLGEGKSGLEDILDDADERLTAIKRAKEAALPLPDLLEYAAALSLFTSAPPGGNPQDSTAAGQLEPPAWFPPFPSDTKMRKGRLNAEAPLGMAGESHTIGQPPSTSAPGTTNALPPAGMVNGRQGRDLRNGFGHDDRHANAQPFDLNDLDLNPDDD